MRRVGREEEIRAELRPAAATVGQLGQAEWRHRNRAERGHAPAGPERDGDDVIEIRGGHLIEPGVQIPDRSLPRLRAQLVGQGDEPGELGG